MPPPKKTPPSIPLETQAAQLQTLLCQRLEAKQRVALLGIGSELRGDDAAGMQAALRLKDCGHSLFKAFGSGTAPENVTGELIRFNPALIIVLDAADMGLAPGACAEINAGAISGAAFSTHTLPLPIIIDYIREFVPCEFAVFGIQPLSLEFSDKLSRPVEEAVNGMVLAVREALSG